jgi:8-oxo-dGTP pyrophosphatase MutT (NUDIX family)
VLLTHHHRLDKWMQLGGHADGGSDVLAVALREAKEESGLADVRPLSGEIFDLDVHEIAAREAEPAHHYYGIRFLFEADRGLPLTVTRESKALAWVALENIRSYSREESVLRMAAKTAHLCG